ncbi:MAG: HD domain-containing protein [Candidatus Woesearchaeota archaeon]
MEKLIDDVYQEVYNLFRKDEGIKKYQYTRRDWIFPNHFEIIIDLVKDMCNKYGGDKDICILGALFHDTGLVYGREQASSLGHEEKSVEYTKLVLNKFNVDKKIIEKVVECVKASEPDYDTELIEGKIVKTADALSQYTSIHFIAKAHFAEDWDSFIPWLKKKVSKNYKKICFEEEMKKALVIRDYYLDIIEKYEKYNTKFPKANLIKDE